jgi:hypothetical protein
MAKAKRSTIQFKKRQLPAVLAARKKNKPMRLKAAAKVAKKKQAAGACSSLDAAAAGTRLFAPLTRDSPLLLFSQRRWW